MHILLLDETNKDQSKARKFWLTGGLVIEWDNYLKLHNIIGKIRADAGFGPSDSLKFDTNSRPVQILPEEFKEVKRSVIQACLENDARFITIIIPHDIIRNQKMDEKYGKNADYVVGRFNMFLRDNNDHGFVLFDKIPHQQPRKYLRKLFTSGLDIQRSKEHVAMSRILLYGETYISCSHLASAVDIVLGAFRYCINTRRIDNSSIEMMKIVVGMMIYKDLGVFKQRIDYGLIIRPPLERIRVQEYKDMIHEMLGYINDLLKWKD